ncbi:MAG: hypothetical protein OXC98_04535 [bacterium]|nr:hypothetical protein [Acidimicrobiia bacterium]MCY4649618.1 hypothetical protein [bacterium]
MGDEAWVTNSSNAGTRIRVKIDDKERVNIPPGQFAQLLISEVVEIPANAVGLLSMKSSKKMQGLINVSGFHVDPGYKGKLIFAVFNAGSKSISLTQDQRTFQLWYVSLDKATEDLYCGPRQNAVNISDSHISNLRGPTYNPTALAERVSALEDRRKWWSMAAITLLSLIVGAILNDAFDLTTFFENE